VRSGCAWHRRHELGFWRALWQCTREVSSAPERFGRQIRLLPSSLDHRTFLAWHVPLFALSGLSTVVLCALAENGWSWDRVAQGGHFVAFPAVASVFAACGVGVTCLTAAVVGVWQRIRYGRNLLSGAIQMACYSAGHSALIAGGLGLWLAAIIWLAGADYIRALERITRIDDDVLAVLLWLAPALVLCVRYVGCMARGAAAMRYANQ